jgi:hypothetical protein
MQKEHSCRFMSKTSTAEKAAPLFQAFRRSHHRRARFKSKTKGKDQKELEHQPGFLVLVVVAIIIVELNGCSGSNNHRISPITFFEHTLHDILCLLSRSRGKLACPTKPVCNWSECSCVCVRCFVGGVVRRLSSPSIQRAVSERPRLLFCRGYLLPPTTRSNDPRPLTQHD